MKRLACVLTAALILGACGSNDAADDPKGALVDALAGLGEYEGISSTITLQTDSETLELLLGQGGEQIPPGTAEKILDSSLTIAARSGETLRDTQQLILLDIGGENVLEVRFVAGTMYARADVGELLTVFGQDPSAAQTLVQQAEAAGFGFVRPALEGKWVSIPGLDKLLQRAGMGQQPVNQEAQERAFRKIAESFEQDATVKTIGEEDAGTHIQATIGLRKAYEALLEIIRASGTPLPPGQVPVSEIPDEDLTLDFWVSDGQVTQIEFDFVQLQKLSDDPPPQGVDRLAIQIAFAEFSEEIEAPAGAVAVDIQQIMQMFMGATAPQSEAFGGEFPCEALKGAPREVLLQYKKECPELLEK